MSTSSRPADWKDVFARTNVVRLTARAELFAEQDEATTAYFLKRGTVERYVCDATSDRQARLLLIEAPEVVGIEEILQIQPRFTSARCVTDVDVLRVGAEMVRWAFDQSADFRSIAIQSVLRAHTQTVDWGRTMSFSTVEQRLARILCDSMVRTTAGGPLIVERIPKLETWLPCWGHRRARFAVSYRAGSTHVGWSDAGRAWWSTTMASFAGSFLRCDVVHSSDQRQLDRLATLPTGL